MPLSDPAEEYNMISGTAAGIELDLAIVFFSKIVMTINKMIITKIFKKHKKIFQL